MTSDTSTLPIEGDVLKLAEKYSRNSELISEEQLSALVKLFEEFNQASSAISESYRALEKRLADLSERLESQEHLLSRTQGFLSSILAHIPVGIIVLDLDGRINLVNEEAQRLTGIRAADAVGSPYGDIFPCDINVADSALFTLVNGPQIDPRERSYKSAEGETNPVRFSTNWVYGKDGKRIGVLEMLEDLSPVKDLHEQMRRRSDLATLGEMSAQVAHELRNPLAGVQGFAQFLLEDIEEEHAARRTVEKIVGGVRDIERIASRLLEYTRPLSPCFSEVDMIDLLRNEAELIHSEISAGNRDIDVQLMVPKERVMVDCDSSLIKQVVLNLLKNACSAIDTEGTVKLGLRWNLLRNRVNVFVEDDGTGIAEENLDKIFNPFFTTRTKGTGLGLAMVKKIVDSHDGVITVRSASKQGARFDFELPIRR
ncbi:PAS domain S-box protein [bacterium]|nr:PAS domain S-box protein [bacterium]